MAPKGATPVFLPFPVFWDPQIDPLPYFLRYDRLPSEGSQNPGKAWDQPLLSLSKNDDKKMLNGQYIRD